LKGLFAAFAVLVVTGSALAEALAPDTLIRQITDDVIASLRHDSAIRAGDSARIAALVETKIVPHFDFRRITRMAVGPAWRHATPEQQDQLTRQFKRLLVRTYSGALSSYSNQTIEVRPLRAEPQDDEVTVKSFFRQSGAGPMAIEYDLERTDAGWKVFEVRVAGVSLVATYRTAFAEEIRNHGVDGLIAVLVRKNNDGAVTPARIRSGATTVSTS